MNNGSEKKNIRKRNDRSYFMTYEYELILYGVMGFNNESEQCGKFEKTID